MPLQPGDTITDSPMGRWEHIEEIKAKLHSVFADAHAELEEDGILSQETREDLESLKSTLNGIEPSTTMAMCFTAVDAWKAIDKIQVQDMRRRLKILDRAERIRVADDIYLERDNPEEDAWSVTNGDWTLCDRTKVNPDRPLTTTEWRALTTFPLAEAMRRAEEYHRRHYQSEASGPRP